MSAAQSRICDDLDAGSVDDRRWFRNRHGRNHRLRKPIGAERQMYRAPAGFIPLIVVRQVAPGSRLRAPFGWRSSEPLPLNAERIAEMLFFNAIDGQHVTILDRSR